MFEKLIDARQVDCGDIPISPYDNALAIDQIETAYSTLISRPIASPWAEDNGGMKKLALDGKEHPRVVTLGGDHTSVHSWTIRFSRRLTVLRKYRASNFEEFEEDLRTHQCHCEPKLALSGGGKTTHASSVAALCEDYHIRNDY